MEREEREVRVALVSAQKGRFQADAVQLYITFQKASELKNNSHLFILPPFLPCPLHIVLCISVVISPGLISFGDLAWSLEEKAVLFLEMHLFQFLSFTLRVGWGGA